MKLLVIGGAGFIGTVLAARLRASGYDVVVMDKKAPNGADPAYVQADIREAAAITPHFEGVDVIINLAAEHQDDVRPLSLYTDVNVGGAENICAAAAAHGVSRVIFTSSVAVYGHSRAPLTEASPHSFFNEYGRTKHLAEAVFQAWRSQGAERRLHIVRPTVIFGPGNRGNVFNLLRQIKYGPFLMVGAGESIKSIAHVENISAFLEHVLGLESDAGVFNYSDGPDFTMAELVGYVDSLLGRKKPRLLKLPVTLGLVLGKALDGVARVTGRSFPISAVRIEKFCSNSVVSAQAARSTGFTPPVELRDGLRAMVLDHV
jgi:nucleoside-diphosphate-sugar epimerase